MGIQTHRFSVSVDCGVPKPSGECYQDSGFLILPEPYTDTGEPTRLIINCHGAGGTVTRSTSRAETIPLTAKRYPSARR